VPSSSGQGRNFIEFVRNNKGIILVSLDLISLEDTM
jgi:hypothetical protein